MFTRDDIRDGRAVVMASASGLDAEQLEVLGAYQAMQQALVSADHVALRAIVEDGTTFTHISGYTQTKEEFISEVGGALTYFHSDVRDVDVEVDGDWTTLTGTVVLTARAYGAEGTFPLKVRQALRRVVYHGLSVAAILDTYNAAMVQPNPLFAGGDIEVSEVGMGWPLAKVMAPVPARRPRSSSSTSTSSARATRWTPSAL